MRADDLISSSPEAISCDLDSGAAILDSKTNLYFALNAAGALLWGMLPSRPHEMSLRLAEVYGIDIEHAQADVSALLGQLQANGLIEVTE